MVKEKRSSNGLQKKIERRSEMVKLFDAKSHVDEFLGFNSVEFFWYCRERGKAIVPYDEVIMDYETLGEGERKRAEYYIDTLLTDTEVKGLRKYLDRVYKLKMEAQRIPLPVIFEDDEFPIGEGSSVEGLFLLYKDKDYSLNLPIAAKYFLNGCPSKSNKGLSSIHVALGEMFANCLFDNLKVPVPNNLREIIEEIYADKSLFVSKG
jgi:hypothetical protein